MKRQRLEHAHAAIVDLLKDFDLKDPDERRSFEGCLRAAHLVGEALERHEPPLAAVNDVPPNLRVAA